MKKGFTLIELLVVISIMTLLIVGAVAGLATRRKERDVQATAEKLRNFIVEARSMALTPKDTSFGLEKIQVRIATDPKKITLWEIKGATTTEVTPQNFEIPRNTTIRPPSSTNGNMSCAPNCSGTPPIIYYFFSFNASNAENNLGQVVDLVDPSGDVSIDVSQADKISHLQIDQKTGSVTITNP